MSENAEEQPKQYVYLGNLAPVLQDRFLRLYKEANSHGVTSDNFVNAWNSYAMTIEEHVFITDNPGTAQ